MCGAAETGTLEAGSPRAGVGVGGGNIRSLVRPGGGDARKARERDGHSGRGDAAWRAGAAGAFVPRRAALGRYDEDEEVKTTAMSDKQLIVSAERVSELLAVHDFIEFALLFGSFARAAPQPWSDVDIAIHVSRPLALLELGRLTAALERGLGRDVDVLVLNTALDRNPALAYRVISEGMLLFCRSRKTFVDFKTRAILGYLDTAFLRAMIARAFLERLETGRFGTGG